DRPVRILLTHSLSEGREEPRGPVFHRARHIRHAPVNAHEAESQPGEQPSRDLWALLDQSKEALFRDRDDPGWLERDRGCREGTSLEHGDGAHRFSGSENFQDQIALGAGLDDLDLSEEEKVDAIGGVSLLEDRGALFVGVELAERRERGPVVRLENGENGNGVEGDRRPFDHSLIIGFGLPPSVRKTLCDGKRRPAYLATAQISNRARP